MTFYGTNDKLHFTFQETEKDIPLKDLELSVQAFNEKLEQITNKQKESITSLLRCSDLVQWLRSALPGH
jgi:hypothetical protein